MGAYEGPATVILPEGTRFGVVAYLQSTAAPGMQIWRGVLTSDDGQALWDIAKGGRATIRLPSGREGTFAPAALEGLTGRELRINGSGVAPC